MTFDDIKASEIREKIFPMVLEEACRQWCDGLADVPERADGEGFAEFFYEIFQEKELEYAAQCDLPEYLSQTQLDGGLTCDDVGYCGNARIIKGYGGFIGE